MKRPFKASRKKRKKKTVWPRIDKCALCLKETLSLLRKYGILKKPGIKRPKGTYQSIWIWGKKKLGPQVGMCLKKKIGLSWG